MTIFRCNRSGNTISVNREDDIARLRKQENYTEVIHESKTSESGYLGSDPKENDACETVKRQDAYEGIHEGRQKEGQDGNVLKKRGRGRPKH